jgi:MFS transporter, DHA1 family, multidrug resistance protein
MSAPSAPAPDATGSIPLRLRDRIAPGAPLPGWLPLLLGLLAAVGPFSTDLYLPAFPAIEADLRSGTGSAQLTLAAWFVGLAIGQISQGPLADRFGRRGPLLIGTLVYTIASVGCALADNLWLFCLCRVLAAAGGSASMVIPRAIIRDLVTGHAAARLMSRQMLIMGVVPILAPALGGLLLAVASWRTLFWITSLYGVVSLACSWALLPDTLAVEKRIGLSPVGMLARFVGILRERVFLSHTLVLSFGAFTMFSYLSAGPTLFESVLHLTPTQYGMVFGLNACGFIGMTQVNGAIVRRVGIARLLRIGIGLASLTAAIFLGLALPGWAGDPHLPVLVLVPTFVTIASLGLVLPNASVIAMIPHPHHAGSAAALMGTIQYAVGGAFAGILMNLISRQSAVPLGETFVLGACGMIASLWLGRGRMTEA